MDVIFDVDGTLLDIEHRVPLIRPTNHTKKDWAAFREAAINDKPNSEIIRIAAALRLAGNRIIISTGRMEKEREVTKRSLEVAGLNLYDIPMYMRTNDDCRLDAVVKREMLVKMRVDGYNPVLAFDDRQQVVDMWRSQGIRCCQVAKGDF
jgi:phosphoglycolate phosphatase-like HAD superfamily hydrolase